MATTAPLSTNSGNNAFKASRTKPSIVATAVYKLILLLQDKEKPMAVRNANIMAARGMPYASYTRNAAEVRQLLQMP